ncbi:hypothetical protein ROZALSC1DRAFT_23245, partial [Rozella allomycis CSF55]
LKSRIPRSDPSNREYYVMKDMANDYLAISVSLLLPLNNGRTVVPKIVATEMVAFHVACHQQLMFLIDLLSFKDEYLLDIKINEELRRVLIGRFQNFFKDIVDHVNLKKLKLSKFIEENGSVTLDFSDSLNYESSDIFERVKKGLKDINGLSELTKHMILVDFNNFIEEKKEALHSTTETLIYSLYMFIAGFVTNVDQQLFVDNKIIEFFESLCSKAVGLIKHLTWAIDQFPNEKLSDRDFQSLINDYGDYMDSIFYMQIEEIRKEHEDFLERNGVYQMIFENFQYYVQLQCYQIKVRILEIKLNPIVNYKVFLRETLNEVIRRLNFIINETSNNRIAANAHLETVDETQHWKDLFQGYIFSQGPRSLLS